MQWLRFLRLMFFCSIISIAAFTAGCDTPTSYWGSWIVNDSVLGMAVSNGKVYFGGGFTQVYANTGGGAWLDKNTGMILGKKKVLFINGVVRAVAPDGSGGWYIGGDFTRVGTEIRNHIARINADGSLNAWNPNSNGNVRSIVVKKNTVYVGGEFAGDNSIGVTPVHRDHIAALNAKTGEATLWDPDITDDVYCMALSGTTLYVGGSFNGDASIGSAHRDFLAALNTAGNGTSVPYVRDWEPDPDNSVLVMALSGTTLYVGGAFSNVDGDPHPFLVALDTTATTPGNYASSWNPEVNDAVYSLAVSGTTLYTGGVFTQFGSVTPVTRNHIAAFNTVTNVLTDWNPNANNTVFGLACLDGVVYAAGEFTTIDGITRNGIAALNAAATTASTYVTAWDPHGLPGYRGICVYSTAKGVYYGGTMTGINYFDRNGLACVDTATGLLTSWDPKMTGSAVRAITVAGNNVYVGGFFDSFNAGVNPRINVAVLRADTSEAGQRFDVNGNVYALAVSSTTLYVGGNFTTAGYNTEITSRSNLAAFKRSDGTVINWDPNPNSTVSALALSGSTLYAGGEFSGDNSIGVTPVHRDYIAAIDTKTGEATDWDPDADNAVLCMTLNGGTLYVGGYFSQIDGRTLGCVGALKTGETTHGLITKDWNPDSSGEIRSMSYYNKKLYVGGNFLNINSQPIQYLAALDTTATGTEPIVDMAWVPDPSNQVRAVKAFDGIVFAGGDFSFVDSIDIFSRMAAFSVKTALPYGY
jgi:hypothetical protein